MLAPINVAVKSKYLPEPLGKKCLWKISPEFRENEGLATLGLLQKILASQQIENCTIDLKEVEWADPQPLLCLGLVLAESSLIKDQIILNLGSANEKHSTPAHRIFLKFLAQQGFLIEFDKHAQLLCEGKVQKNAQDFRLRLATEPQATYFLNADCIFARIFRVDQHQNDHITLQETVEELLKEAKVRAIGSAFGAEPLARDMLFQKLRKLLYELLLNVAEHSHPEGMVAYAGIYARIRGPKPPVENDATAKPWNYLFDKAVQIYGQRNFSPNPYAEWLELFVCDIGVGLTAHIAEWKEPPDDPEVARDLQKAKQNKNPLDSIAHRLFRNTISRHPRHDSNRTAVTGLQHLGHLLAIGGDYCRIYTQNGCWIGGHMPWTQNLSTYSRKDIRDSKIVPKYANLLPVSGTAYAFSLQPNHYNLSQENTRWVCPDDKARLKILSALINKTIFSHSLITEFYDRRTLNSCLPPPQEDISPTNPEIIVLRPPRLTSKLDVSRWLDLVAGNPSEMPTRPVNYFVIADLTPFQILTFRDLLLNVNVNKKTKLDIYLVTEHWFVYCLTTSPGSKRLESSDTKAALFIGLTEENSQFSIADLGVLLRQMDSEIFWQSEPEMVMDPFFNEPVDWHVSKDKEQVISLQRYLDFPRALSDPKRYRACRRALRRCLALYPNHLAVGADDLVATLVRDAMLSSFTRKDKRTGSIIVVGSVAVTAGTVNRLKFESNSESIQMMIHGDVQGNNDSTSLAAMLWISQLPSNEKLSILSVGKDKNPPWRRIPNTPYIAPLGEQSVSILRYKRRADGSLDFSKALYGRTPEETYNDFQRLGIIKTGHWKYGSRHDLQTINMRLAFRFSFLELGPLYSWLKDRFETFFSKKNKRQIASAQLLIYPSHPVTDTMIDRIKQDPGFAEILPEGGMIPVKFLGMHTVSPLLASHLVAHRIQQVVKDRRWEDWSAVIFDDGAVSGKHMRELTQFLQGLKAKVYTLALLDRTGLPAQEAVFESFTMRHKRFWRWDVPALGNKRDCPLCQGLAIAQTYSDRLPSERQKKRLGEWMEAWKIRDVDTEWHQGGLKKTYFASPLQITFGVDEKPDGKRKEKHLFLNNSSSAASILLELTRLTTSADVIIKKAKSVAVNYPDAAIEIIASQLLLFLDELNLQHQSERFIQLIQLIWIRPDATQAMSLAALCFTLADHEVLKKIWNFCKVELLPKQRLGNLDSTIAAYILRSRFAFVTKEQYQLPENACDIERHNYIMLGGGGSLRSVVRNFLAALHRNPAKHNQISTHTNEIRLRLVALSEITAQTETQKIQVSIFEVLQDIRQVEQIFLHVRSELIAEIKDVDLRKLSDHACQLEIELEHLNDNENQKNNTVNSINNMGQALHLLLYGEKEGLVKKVGNQFFKHFKGSDDIDNNFVANIVRSIRQNWPDSLCKKRFVQHNENSSLRWQRHDKSIITPDIFCSTNAMLEELWLYCDSFVRLSLEDTLANVYHAIEKIKDPWFDSSTEGTSGGAEAHLWWRVERDENYAMFKTANASANQKISLKQTVNFAGLERAGGSIADVEIKNDSRGVGIAYISLRIPLHAAFIKENL